MSSENAFLALRLHGPLQSWGFDSQFNRRNTGLVPTKSALAGMCCAALGFHRGSAKEQTFLANFALLRLMAIAIPRMVERNLAHIAGKVRLSVRRLQDYHTVGGGYDVNRESEGITVTAETGKTRKKNDQALAVLTYRQYLTDAF